MPSQPMTIGMLARAAGVHVETVRYYQRRGLIQTPPKALGGQRRYAVAVLRQIAFIRRAQALGFTLDEVAGLLEISAGTNCAAGKGFAQAKLEELTRRMAQLKVMVRDLKSLVEACEGNRRKAKCPVIAHLDGDDETA